MKQALLSLLLSLTLLGSLSACQSPSVQEPAPEEPESPELALTVRAATGSATEIPKEAIYDKSPFLTEADGWRYYCGTVSYEGQTFAMVWRERNGDHESLCSVHQPQGENLPQHTLTYQMGAEESGGRFLYFSIRSGQTGEQSLWMLDTQEIMFDQMYAGPCSNLVKPQAPGRDWQGLGWLLYNRYLIPIDLDQGSEYTAGIQELSQSTFAGENGVTGNEELVDAGNDCLQIIRMPGTKQEKTYLVNYTDGTILE